MAIYSDSFDTDFGNWVNDASADMGEWLRKTGATSSNGTGPSAAADGTHYLYIEASNGSYQAFLNFTPTLSGDARISFQYHMYGDPYNEGFGPLMLEALVSGQWVPFWAQAYNQGNQWNQVSDLQIPQGATSVRFVGGSCYDFQIDTAIDDVVVEDGLTLTYPDYSNTETPILESFEDQTFGIFTASGANLTIGSSTPSASTGPANAYDGTYLAYIEGSDIINSVGTQNITLTNPLSGNGGLLSFAVHMYGDNNDTLLVEYSVDSGATWSVLWARAGNAGNQWILVPDFPYPVGTTHIRFMWAYTPVNGFARDISIDAISIKELAGGQATPSGSATVSATATVTSTGKRVSKGTASISATGSVTATGARISKGATSISSATSVETSGRRISKGTSEVTATGLVASSGKRISKGSASVSATGAVVAAGYPIISGVGTASVSAIASVTSTGRRVSKGTADIVSQADVVSTGKRISKGTASISSVGVVTASGFKVLDIPFGSASVSAATSVVSSGYRISKGRATVEAVASVVAVGPAPTALDTPLGRIFYSSTRQTILSRSMRQTTFLSTQ